MLRCGFLRRIWNSGGEGSGVLDRVFFFIFVVGLGLRGKF